MTKTKLATSSEKFYGHPKFYEKVEELKELHSKKNHDYAGEHDPLRNLNKVKDVGIEPWVGVVVRLNDKIDRLNNFCLKGRYEVNDEGVQDTLRDIAVYAILASILYEEKE